MDLFRKTTTVWKLDGRKVPPGTSGAVRHAIESKKWYGTVNGKHEPLSVDKTTAAKMLRKLQTDDDLRRVGIVDPFELHRDRPIAGHLEDYAAILEGKGSSKGHVDHVMQRIRAIIVGCGFKAIDDIEHGKVSTWLTEQRKARSMIELPKGDKFKPSQAAAIFDISPTGLSMMVKRHSLPATGNGKARRLPRATLEALAERMAQGKAPETINHYIRAIRGFTRWLVRADRMRRNPLEGLSLLNTQVDTRHNRRELTAEQLRSLLDGTQASSRCFRGLTGEDRAHLYLAAAATGFRAGALAHLTAADFDLRGETPVVTLSARYNKSKKAKVQPLPPEAAAILASYLHHKPLSKAIWGTAWLHRGAEMIRMDLEAVGIPYVIEGPHGPEFADFHSLRHTYLTLLGRSGVDLRTAQVLAGHSSPLLTARYTHRRLDDLAGAVARLPMLSNLQPKDFSYGVHAIPVCTQFAQTGGQLRLSESSSDIEQGQDVEEGTNDETPENRADTLDYEENEVNGPSRIRTCNQGIMSQGQHFHKEQASQELTSILPFGLHAVCTRHPEVGLIVEAWPSLPDATQQAILAIVNAAQSSLPTRAAS